MPAARHDEIPVLPEEAQDLETHVRQCTQRYMALVRLHNSIVGMLEQQQKWGRWYRAVVLALLGSLHPDAQKALNKLAAFL